jgi:DNA-binding NarL/FixJ family response regulator
MTTVCPDMVLMDLSMPGLDGRATTRLIGERHPGVRVLVLTSFSGRDDVLESLGAGAVGYVLKDAPPEALIEGIRVAARDETPLAPRAARTVLSAWRGRLPEDELTERELDILVLLAEGMPNKLIARRLGIAEKTVKGHVTHIFRVLGVTDRTQAALWADRRSQSARLRERRERFRDQPGHWS